MEMNTIQNLMILSDELKQSINSLASTNHNASQETIQKQALTEIDALNQQIKYLHEYLKAIGKIVEIAGQTNNIPYWHEIKAKVDQNESQ